MSNICLKCLLLRWNNVNLMQSFSIARVSPATSHLIIKPSSTTEFRRDLTTSPSLFRNVYLPNLNQSKVNMQKRKQIRYSEDYIEHKIEEHELGVRRLAVMMGEDPNTFTQADVKKAIRYLFPSDLTTKSARPHMDHPRKVFPSSQQIQADKDGRPFHHLFYTSFPELFAAMNQAYLNVLEAQKIKDASKQKEKHDPIDLDDSRWVNRVELKTLLSSEADISEALCGQFIAQMERLAAEPFSDRFHDFIMKYRVPVPKQTVSKDFYAKIETDEIGRKFACSEGKRKTAIASVKLISDGTGKITINGKPMREFFCMLGDRETLITPFTFLKLLRKFDVEATVDGGFAGNWSMLNGKINEYEGVRKSVMAGAIRLAVSRALLAFVDDDQAEQMRRAGLLTPDPRRRERKKPGQAGARRKFTWRKR